MRKAKTTKNNSHAWTPARRKKFERTIRAKRGSLRSKRKSSPPTLDTLPINVNNGTREALNYLNQADNACLLKEKILKTGRQADQPQKLHRLDRIIHLCLLMTLDALNASK